MNYNNVLIKDIIGWDVKNWSQAIPFWEGHTEHDLSKCYALEVGAGDNGGLSLWLALRGCRVICSNPGGVPERARAAHKKHHVSSNIEYQDVNALSIPYKNTFDVIAFKSVLGGIGRHDNFELQKLAIMQMYEALKTGGELFFAENLSSTKLHMFLRRKYSAPGRDQWRYITIRELREMLSSFSNYIYNVTGFLAAISVTRWLNPFFGTLDQKICRHIVPEAWNYIIFGIAKK